ncbi:MerR family transcriptional regulator [Chitinophagaceae bacterium LWZ2-11]
MQIGELSKRSGYSRDTIRYYEKLGLININDKTRNSNQYKNYPEQVLKRLQTIREIKEYGFTLQETMGILILFEEGALQHERGKRFVQRKINGINNKIDELIAVRNKLQTIVDDDTDGNCAIGQLLKGEQMVISHGS